MSDIFSDITGLQEHKHPVCRVAYTLNNTQPVLCTIVGDQPLFYMDFEAGYEDEEDMAFDAADMNILEGELDALKCEIDKFDTFSEGDAVTTEEKIESFLGDSKFISESTHNDVADLKALKASLLKSRLAAAYLECAAEHNVEVVFSSQVETAFYDRKNAQILINPSINKVDQIFLATQELRRHWQHRQGALIHPLMFHPDNAVLVNRVQVADLIVSIIRVAWELQLSGEKEAWEWVENSSMADLGRAFAREAYLDFRTINNGQAAAAVFEAWFLSERCRAQDKILINQMLADHKGYVFDLEQCEKAITPNLIAALGEMPFGKNYLAEHAVTIMDDAIFTDVRDRSNANFLWFIKFERSFRETEQELQTHENLSSGRVSGEVHSSDQSQKQGQSDEHIQSESAQIVSLFDNSGERGAETGDKSEKSGKRLSSSGRLSRNKNRSDVSNVVYLRRWSGE